MATCHLENMSNPKYNSSGNGHMRAKLHEGGGEDTVHELMQPWGNDCNAEVERYRERKDEVDNGGTTQSVEGSSVQKKRRVVWSAELHQMFVEAVNLLGVDKVVPKEILRHMKTVNLTREHVASHLKVLINYIVARVLQIIDPRIRSISRAAAKYTISLQGMVLDQRQNPIPLMPLDQQQNPIPVGGNFSYALPTDVAFQGSDTTFLNLAYPQNNEDVIFNNLSNQEMDNHLYSNLQQTLSIPSQNIGQTSDFRCASVDTWLSDQMIFVCSFLTQNVEIGEPNYGNQMMLMEYNPLEQSTVDQNDLPSDINVSTYFRDLMAYLS